MMNILLPTDFSENAFNAACYSMDILKETTCIFYLLHTYTPPIYRIDYAFGSPGQLGLPDDQQYIAEKGLDTFRQSLEKRFQNPRHTFVTYSAFNTLVDEVNKVVLYKNIDLIIMGTQGATGAKAVLFGSHTVHVIQKAVVPVLVVPSRYAFLPPTEILFATDFEIDYQNTEFSPLLQLAQLWHSKIHILHVTAPGGLTREQVTHKGSLEKFLGKIPMQHHDMPDQELVLALNNFLSNTPVNLLVMVQNKHSFLERLFITPTIRNIGLHSILPFLVLPYKDKNLD